MTDRLSALREAVDDLHRWEFSGEWESFNDILARIDAGLPPTDPETLDDALVLALGYAFAHSPLPGRGETPTEYARRLVPKMRSSGYIEPSCVRAYAPTPPSPAPETLTEAAALSGYRPGMAFGTGGNELPPSPAPEGERTLDAAWADLRAVLPDEWIVILYDSGPPTTYNPGPESPFHGPRYLARADIGIRSGPPRISAQSDESPAAALDALRAALAATPAPEVELIRCSIPACNGDHEPTHYHVAQPPATTGSEPTVINSDQSALPSVVQDGDRWKVVGDPELAGRTYPTEERAIDAVERW